MKKKQKAVLAWHFLQGNKRLRFGKKQLVKVGKKIKVDPSKLELCSYGLHASLNPFDALSFVDWDNTYICRVELSGTIIESSNKLCASERKVLWMKKADKTLHEFACWCAEQVLPIFEKEYPDDNRPRLAIEAKRKWLKKEISDDELDAAWAAAWATAWDAKDAWAAARAAAWAAARAAACDAAWAAAWDAKDAQNKKLEQMFLDLGPKKMA